MITEEMCDQKCTLSKLCEEVILYPQHIKNVRVKDKEAVIIDQNVTKEVQEIEKLIKDRKEAIEYAVKNSINGEYILVIGKGHQHYEEIKGVHYPFFEAEIINQAFLGEIASR